MFLLQGGSSLKKDCFMYRAYIAQHKYRVVLDGILDAPSTPTGLKGIRKAAEYFNSIGKLVGIKFNLYFCRHHHKSTLSISLSLYFSIPADSTDKRSAIVKYFDENRSSVVVEDENADEDTVYSSIIWALSAASVYYNEQLYENALSLVHTAIQILPDLECFAMQLQCHLKINRLDLAKVTLSKMQEKDDDATLTQLATAWIHIEQGGEKLQDAFYIFQDFCDKFVSTSLLLNGQAVCFIAQEKYEEADGALRNSLDKDPNNLDTFINLIALAQHYNVSGKSQEDVINRYLSQIKDLHPYCQLVVDLERKEQEFQRLCARYAPSNQA